MPGALLFWFLFQCLVGCTSRLAWYSTRYAIAHTSNLAPGAKAFAVGSYSHCWKNWVPAKFEDNYGGVQQLQQCVLARGTSPAKQRVLEYVEQKAHPLERFMKCSEPSTYDSQEDWEACHHRQHACYVIWAAVAGTFILYHFLWPHLWAALRAWWTKRILEPYHDRQKRRHEERKRTLAKDPRWQHLHKQEQLAEKRLQAACKQQHAHHTQSNRKFSSYEQMLAHSRRTCQLRAELGDARVAWEAALLAREQYESPTPYPGLSQHLSDIKWGVIDSICDTVLSWRPSHRRQLITNKQIHDFGTDVVEAYCDLIQAETTRLIDTYGSWRWLAIRCMVKRCYYSWFKKTYMDPRKHLWFLQQAGPDIVLQYEASMQYKRAFKLGPQTFSETAMAQAGQASGSTGNNKSSVSMSGTTQGPISRSGGHVLASPPTVSPFALCQESSSVSMTSSRSSSATSVHTGPGTTSRAASQQPLNMGSDRIISNSSSGSSHKINNSSQPNMFTSWAPMPAMGLDWTSAPSQGAFTNETCCYVSTSPRGGTTAATKGNDIGNTTATKALGSIALCSSRSSSKASSLCASPGHSSMGYHMRGADFVNNSHQQCNQVPVHRVTTQMAIGRPASASNQDNIYSGSSSGSNSSGSNTCGQGSVYSNASTSVLSNSKPVIYGTSSVFNNYYASNASQVHISSSDDASGWFDTYTSSGLIPAAAATAPEGAMSPKAVASPTFSKQSSLDGAFASLTAAQALSTAAGASTAALEQRRQQCWAQAEMV